MCVCVCVCVCVCACVRVRVSELPILFIILLEKCADFTIQALFHGILQGLRSHNDVSRKCLSCLCIA